MTLINNVVIRPPKLLPREIKLMEIKNLENKIAKMQERVDVLKLEINYEPKKNVSRIWMKDIMEAVCDHSNFTPDQLISQRKYKELSNTRSLYFNLCLDLTKHGVTHIARTCGDRDHTTVCHHQRLKVKNIGCWSMSTDEGLALWSDYNKIKNKLLSNIQHGNNSEE